MPAQHKISRYQRVLHGVCGAAALLVVLFSSPLGAQESAAAQSLKQLSLEELLDVEVTSVSRRPEMLSTVPSAIQVITAEDIRRSGAANLPQALRLATNLQVAQVNSSQWVVTARGFGNVLSNKLLVLIDGRTVYTPLYAGVFWDVQNPPLNAIDRIEVISGPGGTLWGANAVNGVISITTKSASHTPGFYAEAGAGTEERGFGTLRYGGDLGRGVSGRVYAEAFSRDRTVESDGRHARDGWHMFQGGFRVDSRENARDRLTLQGDIYEGRPDPDGASPVQARGGNLLGRWTRSVGAGSEFQLQGFFDRSFRDFNNGFTEGLSTYDLDAQHRFPLGERQEIIWGAGVRVMDHRTENLELFRFNPGRKTLQLYSGFVQDAITLVPERLRLTLGVKGEHHTYVGFELQPSARIGWTPSATQLVWMAWSRAVRTPSRVDRDFAVLIAPDTPFLTGGPFKSEKVQAYELGWRGQPTDRIMLSVSAFFNNYRDLRSAEPTPVTTLPITIANGVEGDAWGAELSAQYQVAPRWRLRAGYTWFNKDLTVKEDSDDLNDGSVESNDPSHQALLQSVLNLGRQWEFDLVARYVGELPAPRIPEYVALDLRLGWTPTPRLSVVVVGQNLLKDVHREFWPEEEGGRQIERGVYAKLVWQ